ncbi:hypothetical protein ABPG74_002456 [Tetrahymena malaccensis]
MGNNNASNNISSTSGCSTAILSTGTPEKEQKAVKSSPEELIQSSYKIIDSGKRIIKEINEGQYSSYKMFQQQNRISKQYSIAEDFRYFVEFLEKSTMQNSKNLIFLQQSKQSLQCQDEQLPNLYEELNQMLAQTENLIKFANQVRSNLGLCQNVLLKSSQLIEYIEILESSQKKQIKQKGLKKQLDQTQYNLNDIIMTLEQYLLQKISFSSISDVDGYLIRLIKIQTQLFNLMQQFQVEESEDIQEIPYELE